MYAAAAKSLQSCPTLCDPIDSSPPGSPVPGILQTRTLEWVAISFSNAWKWKVKVKPLSRVRFFPTPQTAAHQAPPPMGFSKQEYWSGLPLTKYMYAAAAAAKICSTSLIKYIWIKTTLNKNAVLLAKIKEKTQLNWNNHLPLVRCFENLNPDLLVKLHEKRAAFTHCRVVK